jgi:hypothetical protein
MKNLLLPFCIALVALSCKKENTQFNSYFWTTQDTPNLVLYVDGQQKGALPYLSTRPACNNDYSRRKALFLLLETGEHTLTVKDQQGNTISTHTIQVKSNSVSSTQTTGGSIELSSRDNCLTVGIH